MSNIYYDICYLLEGQIDKKAIKPVLVGAAIPSAIAFSTGHYNISKLENGREDHNVGLEILNPSYIKSLFDEHPVISTMIPLTGAALGLAQHYSVKNKDKDIENK